jgi:hypothetical protein
MHADNMFAPDPIWKSFTYGKSFEDFSDAHPNFVFHPDVSSIIREHMEDVHTLLLHSYYRYRFLDIAHVRAMQVVEMSLRARHQELGAPELVSARKRKREHRTPKLSELLDWAEKSGLIEDTDDRPSWRGLDKRRIDVLRDLRNYAVHANPETLHGVSIVGLLYCAVDFVNELHDDINIRKARHDLERSIQLKLSRITAQGAILEMSGVRRIVFHVEILYVAPIGKDWDLHLGCLEIFPPRPDEKDNYQLPDPIFLCVHNYETVESTIQFQLKNGSRVRLCPINDSVNEAKYKDFYEGYSQHAFLKPAVFQPLADRRINLKRYR